MSAKDYLRILQAHRQLVELHLELERRIQAQEGLLEKLFSLQALTDHNHDNLAEAVEKVLEKLGMPPLPDPMEDFDYPDHLN